MNTWLMSSSELTDADIENGYRYLAKIKFDVNTGLVLGWANIVSYRSTFWSLSNPKSCCVYLNRPSRYVHKWTCGFEPLDGQSQETYDVDVIERRLKDLSGWWDHSVDVYSVDKSSNYPAARQGFDKAVEIFGKNAKYFNGTLRMKGKYNFFMYDPDNQSNKREKIIDMGS